MTDATFTATDVAAAGLDDWRQLWTYLQARFLTKDFATGRTLLDRIADAAEAANHHPDLTLAYTHLDVRLTSHDAGGITARDVELARTISELARAAGVASDPSSLSYVEAALDTADSDRVRPFWAAMLGLTDREGDLVDPNGVLPNVWFQTPREPTPPGQVEQRWHLDVWVPADQAQSRIDAAIAAGGKLVDDFEAPSFWVLADADGNRSCICTPQDRD